MNHRPLLSSVICSFYFYFNSYVSYFILILIDNTDPTDLESSQALRNESAAKYLNNSQPQQQQRQLFFDQSQMTSSASIKLKHESSDADKFEESKLIKRKPFSVSQSNILENWYAAHRTSEIGPYPSNQDKEILCNETNLTSFIKRTSFLRKKRIYEHLSITFTRDVNLTRTL